MPSEPTRAGPLRARSRRRAAHLYRLGDLAAEAGCLDEGAPVAARQQDGEKVPEVTDKDAACHGKLPLLVEHDVQAEEDEGQPEALELDDAVE